MKEKYQKIIYQECMLPSGFAFKIRENVVNEVGFERLINAIRHLSSLTRSDGTIDKLTIASLFELPYEIENTVTHYKKKDKKLGKKVEKMADELRLEINNYLWNGLEKYYEDV